MRIGIQTWGSHGDIRPLLALAEGLQTSGHDVSLVVTCVDSTEYDVSISKTGVKIRNVASPVIRDRKEYVKIANAIFKETNPVKQTQIILEKLFEPVAAQMYQAAEKLCLDNDLVIGHFFHYPLQIAAEQAGRPYVSVMLVHSAIPSSLQPPVGFPHLGKLGNRLAWGVVKAVLNRNIKTYPDKLRIALGLRPANDLVADVWASHELNLVAISPQICRRQSDWPDHYQVCGFLDVPNVSVEGQVSEALEKFWESGDSPVYMTFGSVMPADVASQKEIGELLSEAARIADCRAIIQVPLWYECGFRSTQDVHYVSASPHNIVFPRCKAVIHHGGAGTTQAATLAGKPSIVVAHTSEQEFWGRELERIGIAPGLIFRRNVTAEQLAKRIDDVIGSSELNGNARKIGAAMREENGVEAAVKLINERFKP